MTLSRLLLKSPVIIQFSLISRINAKGSLTPNGRGFSVSFFCIGDDCSPGQSFLWVVLWATVSAFAIAVILVLLCNCITACSEKCNDDKKEVRTKFED